MLKQKKFPTVLLDDNGAFTNLSTDALSFGRDTFAVALNASEDYLYFGRDKQFPMVYVEMGVANQVANTLTIEYWDGTAWTALPGLVDETKGLTRSGAIQFDLAPADWAKNTVNALSKNWIRIRPSVTLSASTTIQGMNIVFSDDQDLKGIFPNISQYLFSTETTFILRHESARDDIVQRIRNQGHAKLKVTDGTVENIEPWDLLQYEEVRRWSTYLVLENIFSSLQSTEDGMYMQKAEEFKAKAADADDLFFLSLDKDDDGKLDETEKTQAINAGFFFRR
jgi:hypothetical protein